MEDQTVFDHINQLAREEHEIWDKESRGEANDAERQPLRRIELTLDQCWGM